jgi:Ca2+-binding EF-hand superfamily protein
MVMYRALMLMLTVTFAPSMVAAQQPCTTDARQVVNELYRHMLERGADAGSAHWVQQLESGRATVREVVREIAKSNEHTQRFWRQEAGEEAPHVRAVGTLYRHILGRQPDVAGARSWADVGTRQGVGAVVDQLVNSREYSDQFGDWGVPGSGGLRYCGNVNQAANQSLSPSESFGNRPARRFRAMDRNNDGTITAAEWQGSARSFQIHDWNNDGVLSGDEVRPGAARVGRTVEDEDFDRGDAFADLDANRNGRIEPREWHGTVAAFNRLDVNNDNRLSRAEVGDGAVAGSRAVPTSGQFGQVVTVDSTHRWTDTGLTVRAGDTIMFDARGDIRLSSDANDTASAGGAHSGRLAADAPLQRQGAGALIARIGNSGPIFVGNRRSMRATTSGRLFLGVNDDYLADNVGDFEVMINVN